MVIVKHLKYKKACFNEHPSTHCPTSEKKITDTFKSPVHSLPDCLFVHPSCIILKSLLKRQKEGKIKARKKQTDSNVMKVVAKLSASG